eukprot:COSAG01_NODE_4976_length_4577_cov_4.889013_8_plen_80_part_00
MAGSILAVNTSGSVLSRLSLLLAVGLADGRDGLRGLLVLARAALPSLIAPHRSSKSPLPSNPGGGVQVVSLVCRLTWRR